MEHIFFNAHHAPIGAFSTFTLGYRGKNGGFGMEIRQPANQSIYIGMETSPGRLEALPFYQNAESEAALYDVEKQAKKEKSEVLPETGEISPMRVTRREFDVCTDRFIAGDLEFTVYNQASAVPDPDVCEDKELKEAVIPAVWMELTIDNREWACSRRAFVGYELNSATEALRVIRTGEEKNISGIGQGNTIALVTDSCEAIPVIGFTMKDAVTQPVKENFVFGLGTNGALLLNVPAGERKTYRFAVCFFRSGIATANLDCRYYYTRYFSNIEEVAQYALKNFDTLKEKCVSGNLLLKNDRLSEEQHFMMAQAIRSYYGSTELLIKDGHPLWIVNEGEYRMMNTFDLTVDQLFYEMKMNPWTVRNELDLFVERYSYQDSVHFPGDKKIYEGGISFTHDMGARNSFSLAGRSAYELAEQTGCHSYMTQEQLVNWICCAAVYAQNSGDRNWLERNLSVFAECLKSMVNRDHPDPSRRTGIMKLDSSRVKNGAEITTYDSLDTSLGQARNNIYLAGKCWAAYVSLEKIFRELKQEVLAFEAAEQAKKCADTIAAHMTEEGYIPAVIDEDNTSKIIPAIEGLVFPYFTGCREVFETDSPYAGYIECLKRHLKNVLIPGVCLYPDGGWKISSTSNNTWLSKIYLCQFVAYHLLGMPRDEAAVLADSAHMKWLLHPEGSYWAWSDQMICGSPRGSRYYPRGVTSILWLEMLK